MAELVLEEAESFPTINDGEILAAEVVFADEAKKVFKPEEGEKEVIRLKFKITEPGEFQDRVLSTDVAKWFSTAPNCRLRAWVQEIFGEDELPAGFRFDTNSLIGMPCRVVVGARPYTAKDGTEQVWNSVSDVIRASAARTASEVF